MRYSDNLDKCKITKNVIVVKSGGGSAVPDVIRTRPAINIVTRHVQTRALSLLRGVGVSLCTLAQPFCKPKCPMVPVRLSISLNH